MILKIKSLVRKKTFVNGGWLYLLQIFNTVIPLITLPYITRKLGAKEYGTFSIAINIVGYLQVMIEYGFGMSATREIAVSDKNQNYINKIFTSVFLSRVFLLLISLICAFIYMLFFMSSFKQIISTIILLICLFGYCIEQNWLFQGLQEMKYISIASIISRLISVILIFLLVKSTEDLYLYCFLYSISPLLNGLMSYILAKFRFKVKFTKIYMEDIMDELKKGWYVFTTSLSSKIFGSVGITFLGIISTSTVVGIYSVIQKIPSIMMLMWTPISSILYPLSSMKMQESWNDGKRYVLKYRKIFVVMFAFLSLLIALFSKKIIALVFGVEYAQYFYWIFFLLAWLVIGINNNFLGIQILLGSGHDKEYSRCFQISVVITIILNIVLIYLCEGLGASLAPMLSEIVLYILLRYQINRINTKNI